MMINIFKKCSKCGTEHPLENFYKDRTQKDGYQSHCKLHARYSTIKNKEKQTGYGKKYYENNKEKVQQISKQYYCENKEKIKEYHKKYLEENYKKVCEYIKKWNEKNKDKKTHEKRWRSILHSTLKRFKRNKTASTQTLLGYSAQELKEHLDKLGMNWGTDHIDHKIPITWFKPETPCYVVNDLRNLQPLEESINKTKLNSFMTPVSLEYLDVAKEWIKEEYYNKLVF